MLQIAPHSFWDLNFHFTFNKSFTVRWQMSWAIFGRVTVFKIRSTHGQSCLFTFSKQNYKTCASCEFRVHDSDWPSESLLPTEQCISAPGGISETFLRSVCNALSLMQQGISTIKQVISVNMESCKSEMHLDTKTTSDWFACLQKVQAVCTATALGIRFFRSWKTQSLAFLERVLEAIHWLFFKEGKKKVL